MSTESLRIRGCGRLAACLLALSVLAQSGTLQAQQARKSTAKEDHTVASARDRWPIHMTYYPSRLKEKAAVVVLLHTKGGSRLIWTRKGGLAERLQSQGFAVIAADLRKHGQSKPTVGAGGAAAKAGKKKRRKNGSGTSLTKGDYGLMITGDLEAIKKFVYTEHQKKRLNMRKLAVVGAEMSGPLAVVFAANDWAKKPHRDAPTGSAQTPRGQDVKALGLLSPDGSLPGVTINRSMRFLKGKVAFLICVGNRKAKGPLKNANQVYNYLKPISKDANKRINWMNPFPVQLQGTDLLGKQLGVENVIVGFLKRYVGELKDPWRDRRSRAAR